MKVAYTYKTNNNHKIKLFADLMENEEAINYLRSKNSQGKTSIKRKCGMLQCMHNQRSATLAAP